MKAVQNNKYDIKKNLGLGLVHKYVSNRKNIRENGRCKMIHENFSFRNDTIPW